MGPDAATPEVKITRKNSFVACLYSALTTKEGRKPRVLSGDVRRINTMKESSKKVVSYYSKTLVVSNTKIEGLAMKTAQKLCYKNQIFYLRNYVLDLTTLRMYIFKIGKEKPDLTVNFLKEENRVIEVDANLTNRLVGNYKHFFKT